MILLPFRWLKNEEFLGRLAGSIPGEHLQPTSLSGMELRTQHCEHLKGWDLPCLIWHCTLQPSTGPCPREAIDNHLMNE